MFDSNSTTYIEKYGTPTKWLKLAPWIQLYPSITTPKMHTNDKTALLLTSENIFMVKSVS